MLIQLARKIEVQLQKEIESKEAHLLAGSGITDFASYREMCGYITALKEAKEFFLEAARDLDKGEDEEF